MKFNKIGLFVLVFVFFLSFISFSHSQRIQAQTSRLSIHTITPSLSPSVTPTGSSVLLPTPTIIAVSTQIKIGWNLITLPVRQDTRYLAESFLQNINSQGAKCTEIDKWENGTWSGHVFGYPFNNYPIYELFGYFIRCDKGGFWQVSGEAIKPEWVYYTINNGWNLMAYTVPSGSHPVAGGQFYAESFLLYLNTSNPNIRKNNCQTVREIDKFINSSWQGHVLGFPFNNFPISINEAYFIRCDNVGQSTSAIPVLLLPSPTPTKKPKPLPSLFLTPSPRWNF